MTKVRLTDSTLRDGSHALAHQFTEEQVRAIVHALDRSGIEVIEVAHGDGLGGSSFNYGFSRVDEFDLIAAAFDEARSARIAVLLLPGVGAIDRLRRAHDLGASVARIATHCTEADVSAQHFGALELGMETVGFLMLSHRIGPAAIAKQARVMVDAGAQCVYVVDSAGALILGDVNTNQHLAAALGMAEEEAVMLPALGDHLAEIEEYLRGANPRISSAAAMAVEGRRANMTGRLDYVKALIASVRSHIARA